jgi:hypothetical protein
MEEKYIHRRIFKIGYVYVLNGIAIAIREAGMSGSMSCPGL